MYTMTSKTTNGKQRVTLFLNPKLLIQAKAQAVVEDISLTNLIEKILIDHLPAEILIKKPRI